MESDNGWKEKTDITMATIRSCAKRDFAMRILICLNKDSDDGMPVKTIQEISEELDMDWGTVQYNIWKLDEAGFVRQDPDAMDKRTQYYKIVDRVATEKAIKFYKEKLKRDEEWEKRHPKPPEPPQSNEVTEV